MTQCIQSDTKVILTRISSACPRPFSRDGKGCWLTALNHPLLQFVGSDHHLNVSCGR